MSEFMKMVIQSKHRYSFIDCQNILRALKEVAEEYKNFAARESFIADVADCDEENSAHWNEQAKGFQFVQDFISALEDGHPHV